MTAALYVGDKTMRVDRKATPDPGPGEVQIQVAYVGICGTDLHILHGNMDARVSLPAVIGHEMSGTINALGGGVAGWTVGDAVTVMPLLWDNSCPACQEGHQHVCQNLNFIGIDSPGALQSYWNVPAETLVALPDGLSLEHAALVEPVAVSVHDVRRAELKAGDRAVVFGAGPIGVLIANTARHFGASVAVVEIDGQRRRAAASLGFDTIDPSSVDVVPWIEEWTNGRGADVTFEASGATAAVELAVLSTKVRGRLIVVAIHPQPRPVDLQRVFWRELEVFGARVYQRADFETAVTMLAEGAIPVTEIITKVVPLTEISAAFEELQRGAAMKILVAVGQDPSQ